MARVREVIQREMPAGPNQFSSKESALAAEPDKPIVDAYFATRTQAKNAAYRVNGGERGEWPMDRYAAIFAPNPSPKADVDEEGLVEDAWELLIIPRTHVPEAWMKEVNAPGSRRKGKNPGADDKSDDEETSHTGQESMESVAA